MITLGFAALPLTVALAGDADFVAALVAEDGWPAGTQIQMVFPRSGGTPLVWPAAVAGTTASWDVDQVEVAEVIHAGCRRVRVLYREGGTELLWMAGSVIVQ